MFTSKPKRQIDQLGMERRTCVDCPATFSIYHEIQEPRCRHCRDKRARAILRGRW